MLDVNNEKLSSDPAEGSSSINKEEAPLNTKDLESNSDDDQKENAVLKSTATDAVKSVSNKDEEQTNGPVAKEDETDVVEEESLGKGTAEKVEKEKVAPQANEENIAEKHEKNSGKKELMEVKEDLEKAVTEKPEKMAPEAAQVQEAEQTAASEKVEEKASEEPKLLEAEQSVSEKTEEKVETEEKVAEASEIKEADQSVAEKTKEPTAEEGISKEPEPKELPEFDLSTLSLEGITALMQKLLKEFDIKDIRHSIESLKTNFQGKFKAFVKEQKETYVKEGGEPSAFFLSSSVKQEFDELVREYKRKRQQFYKDMETVQKENLSQRLALIDELKGLIDNAEPSTMYKEFRNLQDRWREIGQIPHAKYNDVWRTYHHHVERFYDLLHLNNDFRDLDFKHNLEEKAKLIEKAEALTQEKDVNHAFKELQILHRMWKEDIGPVARELREEVWHKFSEATKKIHKRRHEFQDQLEEKYKANVDLKLAVIDKIKAINSEENKSHKDWQNSIKHLESLRDEFFAIGRVPKNKNEEIWQLFREATRSFNSQKNSFYKGIKKEQSENLKKKLALVEQAEGLKDSEDWDVSTDIFKSIQSEWKKIGHVPRRDSDKIWKRFKDACNHYFDRLHEKRNVRDKDQSAVIEKKKAYMDSLKEEIEKGKGLTLDFIERGLEEWRTLGVLPAKVKHLEAKFNKILDTAFKKLDIDKDEATFLKFKSSVDALLDQGNNRKLDSEQLFVRRKIDDITKEIKQLENNISFISNASEDNPLVKNVYKNIEDHKRSLEIWKRKIDYMKKMDY